MTTYDGWIGHFYRFDPETEGYHEVPTPRLDRDGPLVRIKAEALPWADLVEAASARYPERRAELSAWRDAWNRSFPGWDTPEARARYDARYKSADTPETKRAFHEKILRDAVDRGGTLAWIEARHLMALHDPEPDLEDVVPADPCVEAMRSASATLAFRHLLPHVSVLYAAGVNRILVRHDADGLPVFEDLDRFAHTSRIGSTPLQIRFNNIHWSSFEIVRHWNMPEMAPFRRHFAVQVASGEDPERPDPDGPASALCLASAVLADMAAQGFASATARSIDLDTVSRGQRSWVVPLEGIASARDARERLLLSIRNQPDWNVTLEPTIQVQARQRLFVHDGVVFGSTCPSEGIAIVEAPFDDRVMASGTGDEWTPISDPDLAARFRASAGEIAAVLLDKEASEYALDLALSDGQVVVDAILPIQNAEMYGFDTAHYARRLGAEGKAIAEAFVDGLAGFAPEGALSGYKGLARLILDGIEPGLLTLLLTLDGQLRPSHGDGTGAAGHAVRRLILAAGEMARGLVTPEEAKALDLPERWSTSAFSSFLGSRPAGEDLTTKALHAIVAVKGGSLKPVER